MVVNIFGVVDAAWASVVEVRVDISVVVRDEVSGTAVVMV